MINMIVDRMINNMINMIIETRFILPCRHLGENEDEDEDDHWRSTRRRTGHPRMGCACRQDAAAKPYAPWG